MENVNQKLKAYQKNNLETSLLISLEESLKNEDFYELVSKLDLPKEILCKYTSVLEECSNEYKNCKNCKGLAMCKNKITGYVYFPKKNENKIEFKYQACKYQQEYLKEEKILDNIFEFEVPKAIRNARMKDIYTKDGNRLEVIMFLKKFIQNYEKDKHIKGMYLCGNFGCGKTYLISAMFNELAKKNIKSAIVFWPEFLNYLKNNFNSDHDQFKNTIEKIKKVPLLLIDDIGAENSSSWSRDDILSPILQYRMQESLPTFFTSNLNYKNLEIHFSFSKNGVEEVKARRIMERIKQLTEYYEMISENLRK